MVLTFRPKKLTVAMHEQRHIHAYEGIFSVYSEGGGKYISPL